MFERRSRRMKGRIGNGKHQMDYDSEMQRMCAATGFCAQAILPRLL